MVLLKKDPESKINRYCIYLYSLLFSVMNSSIVLFKVLML